MLLTNAICLLATIGLVGAIAQSFVPDCPPEGEFKLPDPNSCSEYYLCKDGVRSHESCPWFKLFDNVVMDCQKQWIVDCYAVPPNFPPSEWRIDD